MNLSPSRIVWSAAGEPEPCDTAGVELPRRDRPVSHCAKCGASDGHYDLEQLISSNFVPTKNANRIHAFGGNRYCAACVFCARTLRLRCISWFASSSGVSVWRTRPETKGAPRPDALAALLSPPAPPFVCGIPLYGISHGGEAHYRRTWWPGESAPDGGYLIRLQSKHVALYARESSSRDRYPVQVDDSSEFLLDRDVWLRSRDCAMAAMSDLVDAGLKPWPAKLSLRTLTIQGRVPSGVARHWRALVAPLVPHVSTIWWPLFCDLIQEIETDAHDSTREDAAAL